MTMLVLAIDIAGRRAAFPACEVRSVIEIDRLMPVPGTPPHVAGIAALRSQVLTVIDGARALGVPDMESDWKPDGQSEGRLAAVIDLDGHAYALLLDAVHDVLPCEGEPREIPGGPGPGWARAARGLVETPAGPALLLDIGALVAGPGAAGLTPCLPRPATGNT